ncbi:unnamed protein product [Leptidea sinapis]|uniref:CRAL-TRIO domain-containing protein n=1 Tax=Leptidea sinapis TaxID=189913 RepID=A0A5E4QHU2_9NEOP|nr:unnamed protein product [Leptidea sinapis]
MKVVGVAANPKLEIFYRVPVSLYVLCDLCTLEFKNLAKMAATKFSHPMKSQPHLPHISDEFIILFLHSNYYKVKETQETIEFYFTLRASSPDLFTNRDPMVPKNKAILDLAHMVALPNLTPEGYHILLYRLADTDYSKLCFADAVRVFCMFNDIKLSEDRLSEGYVVIFDMKGCSLGHLTRVTYPALRTFMQYIQRASLPSEEDPCCSHGLLYQPSYVSSQALNSL